MQQQGLWPVDAVRPAVAATDGRNVDVVDDIDSWLSTSVILTDKSPVSWVAPSQNSNASQSQRSDIDKSPVNWAAPSQNSNASRSQRSYFDKSPVNWAAPPHQTAVCGINSGTLSTSQGTTDTSAASNGGSIRNITVFAPPPGKPGPLDASFPPRRNLDSFANTSSSVFSPFSPAGMRLPGLAGFWPTPARALCEPSPVATVIPQVQVPGGKPEGRPAQMTAAIPEEQTETVTGDDGGVENTAPAQTVRRRKRKRRSTFGPRRRSKRLQHARTSNPDMSTDNPGSHVPGAESGGNPVETARDTGVEAAAARSTRTSSMASGKPVSTVKSVPVMNQPVGVRRALKPVENVQPTAARFFTGRDSDTRKPSTQRGTGLGSQNRTHGSGSRVRTTQGNGSRVRTLGNGSRVRTLGNGSRVRTTPGNGSRLKTPGNGSRVSRVRTPGNGSRVRTPGNVSRLRTPHSVCRPALPTYIKRRQQCSGGVQKVPTTSPRSDIFEFCGDDDDYDDNVTDVGRYRPSAGPLCTAGSLCSSGPLCSVSSWLTQPLRTPTATVPTGSQKRGGVSGTVAGNAAR